MHGNIVNTYGADGLRASTGVAGQTPTDFLYDYDGSILAHQIWGAFGPQEIWINGKHFGFINLVGSPVSAVLTLSIPDWLGTERARADAAGNLQATFCNLPFGDQLTTCFGTDPNPADVTHFTGKERDAATDDVNGVNGLDYFGSRHYSSSMGRFMSPDDGIDQDPGDPQSLNLYSYALNNPLTNIDPTGRSCVSLTTQDNISFAAGSTGTADAGASGAVHSQSGATFGDDGDGKGCAAAGILPNNQSATDPNGGSTQFDPSNTQNVQVTPPVPGTDPEYDARVAYDENWIALRQPQSAPTSMQYLQAISQSTAPLDKMLNCGAQAGYAGAADFFGLPTNPADAFRDATQKGLKQFREHNGALALAWGIAAATDYSRTGGKAAIFILRNAPKAAGVIGVGFTAYQGIHAFNEALDAYQGCTP